MNETPRSVQPDDPRIKAALAEYMERVDRGEQVDREQFLAAHADIADELGSFIATSEELARMAPPRREDAAQSISTKSIAERDQETIVPQRVQGADAKAGSGQGLPEQFGRYRIVKPLGSGAMGTVYLAEDTQLHRQVALKTPTFDQDDTGELLERFYREARSAATLRHPHICPVHDVGEIGGKHFITMAYIEGRPLSAYIRPDKLQAERQTLVAIRKLALALQEAHDRGIIHRDLKPGNIMIDARGEPIVMDFGLARKVQREDASRLTQSGVIIGSPAYMSPEQVEGDPDKLTPATDQYSLGVILYELLTGQLPFRGGVAAVIGAIMTRQPQRPSELRAGLDPRIEALCLKMMAKSPADRFPSMKAVADAVTSILKQSTSGAVATGASGSKPTAAETAKPTKATSAKAAAAGGGAAAAGAAASITASNVSSLLEAAQKCMRKHDYDQVVQMLDTIPEAKRTEQVAALLKKARQLSDEVQFLLAEIDEALQINDNEALGRKVDELLKLKPAHHRAQQLKEELSRYGKGRLYKPGGWTPEGRRVGEGSWIPWLGIAVGVIAFGLTLWGVTLYLKVGEAVVRVSVNDPDIKVGLQGRTLTVESIREQLKVEPGENTLKITYGDAQFESAKFTLGKGNNPALVVELLDDMLAAKFGETLLNEWPIERSTPAPESADYQQYARGPWTSLWDSEAAVESAILPGTFGQKVTFDNGVLHVQRAGLKGPGPTRNIVVRLKLKHEEGNGCYLSFRNTLAEPNRSYTNWINGHRRFGLGLTEGSEMFNELGGHADVPDLKEGEFYEWMGVADGETVSIYIKGRRMLQMKDSRLREGEFVLWADGGGEATVRDVEYRILEGASGSSPGTTPAVATSPVPPDAKPFQGHSYKFFAERLSWKEAKQRCEQMGGHLPIVETAAENAFLDQLAHKGFPAAGRGGYESVWLGTTDEVKEGEWRWTDGARVAYTNWLANQPNNKQNQEHYALLWLSNDPNRASGQWSDQPNVSTQHVAHFICEWDAVATAAPATAADGWTDLFNGSDLTRWDGDRSLWTIRQGVLSSQTGSLQAPAYLLTQTEYGDFELRLQFRLLNDGNSGVQFRTTRNAQGLAVGHQAEIGFSNMRDRKGEPITGDIHGQGMSPHEIARAQGARRDEINRLYRYRDWNDMTVRCIGGREVVEINGQTTADITDPTAPRSGRIGFQLLAGATPEIEFRGVRIRELGAANGADGWNDLFNGKDLAGWDLADQPGRWTASSGVLAAEGPSQGYLFTSQEYADFELSLEYRLLRGANSGIYLRAPSDARSSQQAIELALADDPALTPEQRANPKNRNGALHNLLGPSVDASNPTGEWNGLTIRLAGRRLTASLNGQQVQDADLDALLAANPNHAGLQRRSGRIGLQHWTKERVEFRNIRVRDLSTVSPAAAATPPAEDQGDWTDLFNGRNLTGWKGVLGQWRWIKDELVGTTAPGGIQFNTALCSDRTYRDFEMEFEVKLDGGQGNSGLQIRSRIVDPAKFIVAGPQADMGGEYWGGLYGEKTDGVTHPPDKAAVQRVLRPNDYNAFVVRCVGKHVTITLNGARVLDGDYPTLPDQGIVGWQLHSGPAMTVRVRNARIRELTTTGAAGGNGSETSDLQSIQGTWEAIAEEYNGAETPPADIRAMQKTLTVQGNHLVIERMFRDGSTGRFDGTVQLNPQPSPGQFDWSGTSPPDANPAEMIGLYELQADTLRIVYSFREKGANVPRPTKFASAGTGAGTVVATFRRRPAASEAAWTDLFNGTDLTGWTTPVLPNNWEVKGSVIVGKGAGLSALFTKDAYDDFELELEYKLTRGSNSGIWFRTPNNTEATFGGAKTAMSLSLLDDASPVWAKDIQDQTKRTGGLHAVAGPNPLANAPVGQWNRLSVRAVGPQVTATINGTLVLDVNTSEHVARLPEYTGLTRTSGYIGLEDHGEDGVEFRNIRIRTIGTPDNEEDALAALQGTWTAVGQEIGGNAWSQEQLAQHEKTITLADDTFEIRYRDRSGQFQVERGTYRLDLTHDPAHITMNGTNRDGGAIEFAGIYQVEGDQLRHCFVKTSDNGAVRRPTSFSTSAGQFATTYRRASAGPAAWTDLLNGTDLSGWAPVASDGAWSVKDGVLSATPGDGWLATDRDYGDFELELDYRIPPDGNTGVFLRAPLSGSPAGIGLLEVQAIDDSAPAFQNVPDRNHTGAVVGLFAASPRADAPPNRWNSLSIRCVGSKITVVVNGRKVSEGDLNNEPEAALKPDMKLPRGRIGLQRRTATGVEFRNIRVREL